ncbi:hypothetical protein GMST_10650 [Geomonas silvestris]|uniref:Uncharacterized protein n=1 Tax=Geomonas silvestris TaxID=2740184 RepID=A0A6V8MFH7_9BACT|nr:hypothetical protein [Geomonas silvestris]GFO58740.1 hypothetical protein GMST_10650 [Geomonas silvestris]
MPESTQIASRDAFGLAEQVPQFVVVERRRVSLHEPDVPVQGLDEVGILPFAHRKTELHRGEDDGGPLHLVGVLVEDPRDVGGYPGVRPPRLHRLEHLAHLVHFQKLHLQLELAGQIEEACGIDASLKTAHGLSLQVHDGA